MSIRLLEKFSPCHLTPNSNNKIVKVGTSDSSHKTTSEEKVSPEANKLNSPYFTPSYAYQAPHHPSSMPPMSPWTIPHQSSPLLAFPSAQCVIYKDVIYYGFKRYWTPELQIRTGIFFNNQHTSGVFYDGGKSTYLGTFNSKGKIYGYGIVETNLGHMSVLEVSNFKNGFKVGLVKVYHASCEGVFYVKSRLYDQKGCQILNEHYSVAPPSSQSSYDLHIDSPTAWESHQKALQIAQYEYRCDKMAYAPHYNSEADSLLISMSFFSSLLKTI